LERAGKDAAISESAVSTTERRPEESEATTAGFEWPEEPEIKCFEEPEESAASAGIREAGKYLLEDAFEVTEKATGALAERVRTDPWRSEESFAEWQAPVATNAGKLADDFEKLTDVFESWRRSGGARNWWKRDRAERWRRAVDSWKRHATPGEMRRMRIRWNRKDVEAARVWRADHGEAAGGEREQSSTEARTADHGGASWTSSRNDSRSLGTAE
jgi:hypothetical protein